ncbi:unnamed protein product [Gongylonema pulchrum]|uniref:Uncharacterized protein n=1 Tax=Gongylonema pulchrum TaxID=637853 RepID=A0A3P7PAA2_9BILA|nr:unnamed protein product [Gongylonema pulchrum]
MSDFTLPLSMHPQDILASNSFLSADWLHFLPADSFYVTVDGKVVDWRRFGSLLRSFRIHRSTNQLMCRDLSGRRLVDIKEEEKLRKWIEKAGEREEEKRRRRQEKYEKLKSGPPKHDFNDPNFIETREKILEETDEAFDAGIAAVKGLKSCKEDELRPPKLEFVKTVEDDVVVGHGSKRKQISDTAECKRPKLEDHSCGTSAVAAVNSTNAKDDTTNDITPVNLKNDNEERSIPLIPRKCESSEKAAIVFEDINLDDYNSSESLQHLGLDHLKHALEVRGLKCGGSLAERAARLYSVKGLKPEQFPKNVRAGGKAKKK